jgi:hypothetical protein
MTNRKNQLGMFVIALCVFGLTVTGCTLTKAGTVYDEAVPLEQSSWIYTTRWLNDGWVGDITGYNGIKVFWDVDSGVIQIPSGNTLLEFNVHGPVHRKGVTTNRLAYSLTFLGALFQYNFQPEKLYQLVVAVSDNGQYGLDVYAWNFGEIFFGYDKKHYVEFVPFLNASSPDRPAAVLN